ncbi:hypothetical protein [Campylobacter sp.]|uniref:hypothetical protein n=1 Tax=Campylobacter sp. TaxID=205 RepID=UPI0025BD692D|nr:hypothetical protein [Campylobacter sp.]
MKFNYNIKSTSEVVKVKAFRVENILAGYFRNVEDEGILGLSYEMKDVEDGGLISVEYYLKLCILPNDNIEASIVEYAYYDYDENSDDECEGVKTNELFCETFSINDPTSDIVIWANQRFNNIKRDVESK